MTDDEPTTKDDASSLEPRTQRARTEEMTVALRRTGGIYSVRGESGRIYRVDICKPDCSCPDYQQTSTDRCKHIRRVDLELRNRTVPTPDGRLPACPVADGGFTTDQSGPGADRERIEGPIQEFDKDDEPTGAQYFRCSICGREAMRRQDLSDCCPAARR